MLSHAPAPQWGYEADMTELSGWASLGKPSPAPIVKCPHCEQEIGEFASEYSFVQSEPVVVVLCPHCRKILGMVNHSCED